MKWTPELVIALALVVGCVILLVFHINGEVKGILAMAAGWAFGSQWLSRESKGGKK